MIDVEESGNFCIELDWEQFQFNAGCEGIIKARSAAMSDDVAIQPGKPCPICGKPAIDRYRPFCSRRCADIDLNRWLSGVYAVPVRDDEDEDGPPPQSD